VVAPTPDNCRRPESRPDVDHGEDPDRLFLAPDNRFDLVCLKLYRGQPSYFSIAEATTPSGCSFQPAMDRMPGNSLDSSDGRLIQALDTEGGDFIKRGATVLESIVGCPVCRAKRLPASPAPIATTLPPLVV
jgi:hypothetical protein